MSGQQITAAGPRSSTLRAEACLQHLRMDVSALLTARTEQLVAALEARDPTLHQRSMYFGPVLDHQVLLRHPFYPDAPSQGSGIPMIIGNTRDETRAFHGNDPGIESLDWSQLPDRLLDAMHVDIDPEYVIDKYRALYPKYSPTEVFFAATTAARSWRGALIELEHRVRQGAPTYAYQLNYRSPLQGGRYGAMHTMDIPLIFDNIGQPESLTGTTPSAQHTANAMSDALIAFARTGNPNHAGIPEWKPYSIPDRPTMIFDAQSTLVSDPRGEERKLFEAVPYIQRGTY
jgi:para-nitrobenzyl esterase